MTELLVRASTISMRLVSCTKSWLTIFTPHDTKLTRQGNRQAILLLTRMSCKAAWNLVEQVDGIIIIYYVHNSWILGQKNKIVMLPSSGKFEILGRSVGFFLIFFFYCIVHEFKLITKCTSFVNQSTMTQSKENIQ